MTRPDPQAAARAIADFLRALGHEPTGHLARTPELVAEAWSRDLLEGYGMDPAQILRDGAVALAAERPNLVVLRSLAVTTICPHHLLPATGYATLMYLPARHVAGLGAMVKALCACTRRLMFQEQAGAEVAAQVVEHLQARGALCQLRLVHGCMVARGARQAAAMVESIAMAGTFAEPGPDRELAVAALGRHAEAEALVSMGAATCPADLIEAELAPAAGADEAMDDGETD